MSGHLTIIEDTSRAAIIRLLQLARMKGYSANLIRIILDGVEVPTPLADEFYDDIQVNPLAAGQVSDICPRGVTSTSFIEGRPGPAGPTGPTGAAGPPGMQGPTGPGLELEACDLDMSGCGGMDPDVSKAFRELFTCLESQGLISDTWRIGLN